MFGGIGIIISPFSFSSYGEVCSIATILIQQRGLFVDIVGGYRLFLGG
jgi:hypothetical protein